ncbi:MAG: CHC2 zinc finger domain-containing protein, partial [Pseudomonadota bacterium]
MARVPEEEIERIKREVDLVRLVEARGVALTPQGRNRIGLCPWHDDSSPSLVITPDKNLWHCFGACARGGSVIDWVMISEGIDFRGAVERLRKELPLLPSAREGSDLLAAGDGSQASITSLSLDAEDRELLLRVVDFYHEGLKASPEAMGYLKRRGLDSPEMIKRFKIGYANGTLRDLFPQKEMRDRLKQQGILGATGHEHFSGSIVIPIFDEQGAIAGMYGRKVNKVRGGSPRHLYLPGPQKGVWNREGLQGNNGVILCEALIDALTFWCAGYPHVTASYGTNGFTEEHEMALKTAGIKTMWIAYDRDEAGEKAAVSLAKRLRGEGIACYRILFPKGMDANEYARCMTPVAKSLSLLIDHAIPLGEGEAGDTRRGGGESPLPDEGAALQREVDATDKTDSG